MCSSSALTISDRRFVCFCSADFNNLSGHRSTNPHHHVKVVDHGGVAVFLLYIHCVPQKRPTLSFFISSPNIN